MSQAVSFEGTERFEIVRRLGAGGMGVVYEAVDRERKSKVALKTLRALDGAALLRFKNEFRAMADLSHPNLIRLGELIEERGTWFFTMELLAGTDFIGWVRPGSISERSASELTTEKRPIGTTIVKELDPRDSWMPETHSGALDESRLRSTALQLAQGLRALHASGMIHRDVKPSNVIVTPEGRAVLLDFGLVAPALQQDEDLLAGTVAYMAPEQAQSGTLGPAADWYALGVMLYEAITGRLPYHGSAFELLRAKQKSQPENPKALAPNAPDDLCALAMDLLQPKPEDRPSGEAVIERLGEKRPMSLPPPSVAASFVGRERELDQLRRAWESSREGRAVTVYVHGESGVGKTALVRTFAARVAQSDREVVILTGRCYERESVPYKAVDGVVDSISRLLGRLPSEDAVELIPPNAHLLSQLFPVLGQHLEEQSAPDSMLDPAELRARAFAVLRELLARIARKLHAIVLIDDLQWADPDSLVALRDIMMPPAPSLMLVATVRTTSGSESTRSVQIPTSRLNVGSSAMPGDVRDIPLGRLGRSESLELARQAAMHAGLSTETCEAIAEEAGGHPLFIDELARHAATSGKAVAVKFEDAVWARIRAQEKRAQELAIVACVSGSPLPAVAAAHAAGFEDAQELDAAVGWLRQQHLVRTTRRRGVASVEPYHDRVRQAVLGQLPEERADIHRRIALGLEKEPTREPEMLATHWLGAGDRKAASKYAVEAADVAASALAFDRAARLYAWAIDLDPPDPASLSSIELRRGEALASAGRGYEAARAFLQAAAGAGESEAFDLRRRAAENLLLSGRIDEGMTVLREVLAAVGMEIPATPARALASIAYRKARLRLRGLGFKQRTNVPQEDLRAVDVCWTASMGLGLVDTLKAADFHLRGVLLALGTGDARRISRALAIEGTYVAADGGTREAWSRFVDRGIEIARKLGDPRAIAIANGARGISGYLAGEFRLARTACEESIAMLREMEGMSWYLDMLRVFSLRALWMLGETRALVEELPVYLRDAENRGDLFFSTNLRTGFPCLAWLAVDDPDGARAELDAARASWSTQGIHLQHAQEVQARVHADLYENQGEPALHRIDAAWPGMEKAGHLRVLVTRVSFLYVRARACIAAARTKGADKVLLARAIADANEIARTGAPHALATAALLRGAIAAASGDDIRAKASFEIAARDLAACDMGMMAAVARRRRGEITGDAAQIEEADRWLKAQAVIKPERIARMLAP